MNKTRIAFACFTAFSIIACSSGSNEQPGEDAQLVALRNSQAIAAQKIADLEAKIKTLQEEKSTLNNAQEALQKAKQALEVDKQALAAKLAESAGGNPVEIQALRQEIADKAKQVTSLQQTIADQTAQIARLQSQVVDLTSDTEAKAKAEKEAQAAAEKAQKEKEAADKAKAEQDAAQKAVEEAAAQQAKNEAEKQAALEAQKKAEAEKLAKEAIVKQYATRYFSGKPESVTYQILTDEAKKADFIADVKKKTNLSAGNCAAGTRGLCSSSLPVGTIVQSYTQSYAGYAVIREKLSNQEKEESQEQASMPNNSYVYYVDTPTTDKSMVKEGYEYKGMVSYSRQNKAPVVSNGALTLKVHDNQISGKVTTGTGSKARDVMVFDNANIVQNEGRIDFSGNVTFKAASFSNKEKADIDGTYRGTFAGANAEQVVGVFESNHNEAVKRVNEDGSDFIDAKGHRIFDADKSVQGAFWGTRE